MEFLKLKGGCTGSSESINIKMSQCWKSHASAQFYHFRHKTITAFYKDTMYITFLSYFIDDHLNSVDPDQDPHFNIHTIIHIKNEIMTLDLLEIRP